MTAPATPEEVLAAHIPRPLSLLPLSFEFNEQVARNQMTALSQAGYAVVRVGDAPPWMEEVVTLIHQNGAIVLGTAERDYDVEEGGCRLYVRPDRPEASDG